MGGWDYYCFLCAAGFHVPYEIEHDEEPDESDNEDDDEEQRMQKQNRRTSKKLFPRELLAERLQWLSTFRLIGQNRNAPSLTQCYLTGPAVEEDFGQAMVEHGTHPNAQSIDGFLNCYHNGDEETGDLPVHDSCFSILCEVFAQARRMDYHWTPEKASTPLPFELDALFLSLAEKRQDYQAYLSLDHNLAPDQYFWVDRETVCDYFDPSDGPQISSSAIDTADAEDTKAHTTGGLFDALPHELLTHILDLTPQVDLVPFMKATRSIHRITKSNKFWHHRLRLDAPWFWEIRDYEEDSATVDWHSLYNTVMMQAQKPIQVATKGAQVSGLANRRRIWKVCEQVLKLYLETNTLQTQLEQKSIFEEGVTCRYLPAVATSKKTQTYTADTTFFFDDQSDMHSGKRLQLYWTDEGALCGICLTTGAKEVTFGDVHTPGAESSMEIEPGDWIEKLILSISAVEIWKTTRPVYGTVQNPEKTHTKLAITGVTVFRLTQGMVLLGQDVGSKRLLEPLPGNGIVGLKCQSSQGVITHLGILEHPGGMTKHRAAIDPHRLDYLWTGHLPAQELRLKDFYDGYWSGHLQWDMAPMRTLVFGATDPEQATMIGFGASADLRRLEIYRSNGSCETIGPGEGHMKVFPVDGPGGERIAGYELTIGALPVGLTLVTTNGRQAVFGKRRDNARHGHTSEHGFGVAGLYCSFEYHSIPENCLSSVGLIQSPHIDRPPMNDQRIVDENDLVWEPQPPPSSWRAIGPVYGPQHNGEVATCLDFSRPVTRIDGLFPAPDWMSEIELGGFKIFHGDDNTLESSLHFGFPPQWPTSAEALRDRQRRFTGMMLLGIRDIPTDTGKAHVLTDEEALNQPTSWDLGPVGEKIVAVTVWSGAFIHGLQFHSESGQDSPRWGKCGGEPSAKIHVGGKEGIVGLKFILGSKRLEYIAPTLTPHAVQVMSDAPQ